LKTIKTAVWSCIYVAIFYLSQVAAFSIFTYEMTQRRALSMEDAMTVVMESQAAQVLGVSAVIGIFVLFLLVFFRGLSWNDLIEPSPIGIKTLIICFGTGACINAILSVLLNLAQNLEFVNEIYSGYLLNTETLNISESSLTPIGIFLIMGFVVPIYEEIVFRGLILREMAATVGIKFAIFGQALIFGVCHGNIIQGIFAFFLAIILGISYMKTKSIWAPVFMHCGFNLLSYAIVLFM